MKNTRLALYLILLTLTISSFKSPMQNYGPWQATCYKGLDYCTMLKKCDQSDGRCEWRVKFRNRYQDVVNFSSNVTESSISSSETRKRDSILPGRESTADTYYLSEASSVNVFVGKVTLGKDNYYSSNYVTCGN